MPNWIRVRDTITGHEFDVREETLAGASGVEVIEGYPSNAGPNALPRPAKHRVDKAGQAMTPTSDGGEAPRPRGRGKTRSETDADKRTADDTTGGDS